jgi:ribosomal protein S18 acetylase RimI-like enzyme
MVTVRRTERLHRSEFEQLAAIYVDSFPPEQREDPSAVLDPESNALWVATDDAETVAGFAVVGDLPATASSLLDYLAVRADRRGAGVGRALLDALAASPRRNGRARRIVLEVEPADSPLDPFAARRVGFYERWGAVLVLRDYRMPNLAAPGALPMWLMSYELAAAPPPGRDELRAVVRDIWTEGYGRPADDPDLLALLAELTAAAP